MQSSQQNAGGPGKAPKSTRKQDSVMMYCSFFTYGKDGSHQRQLACDLKEDQIIKQIQGLESK